jgi:hypothetical protein
MLGSLGWLGVALGVEPPDSAGRDKPPRLQGRPTACWMPAEGVFWLTRRQFSAVWGILAVIFAVVSSLVVGLAVNAVPKSWGWGP